jgi:hypothetical protein
MMAALRSFLNGLSRGQRVALGSSVVVALLLAGMLAVAVRQDGSGTSADDEAGATSSVVSTMLGSTSTTPSSTSTTTASTTTSTTAAISPGPSTTVRLPLPNPTPSTAPATAAPEAPSPTAAPPPPAGTVLDVPAQYPTLQAALDAAGPGTTVRLATAGDHAGPAISRRDGAPGAPIVITGVPGARLSCPGGQHRCLELSHSWFRIDGLTIQGGTSNLYLVGPSTGVYVHDVKIVNSTFRGRSGTGECIRVKYQAFNVEIANNDIADCGLGKCCSSSKSGEGIYIGTAPEQLADKNPSPERDRTHDVWIHHNVIHPYNECVDIKEASFAILVEHNTCGGQRDPESGAFGSRGGRPGEGNTFRFNTIENALGACVRFGGDADPDGTGNAFHDNVCRDIGGEYGVKQMRTPQGPVCGNRFEGVLPSEGLSRDEEVDPTASC